MKKMLGIAGSPRKGGNSDVLMKLILKGARDEGIATEEIQLRDYQFQPCNGCERCRKDKRCTGLQDGMQLIYPRLYSFYDFSDERPGNWSSQLANQGRKAMIAVVGEQNTRKEGGMDLTLETIRRNIEALGYEVTDELPVLGIFHKGRVREYPQVLEQAEALGRRLASLLQT